MYTYVRINLQGCIHIFIYMCTYTYTYICIYMYIYVYITCIPANNVEGVRSEVKNVIAASVCEERHREGESQKKKSHICVRDFFCAETHSCAPTFLCCISYHIESMFMFMTVSKHTYTYVLFIYINLYTYT